jgi:glycosyltransferase involved in cell wall biosynthesis
MSSTFDVVIPTMNNLAELRECLDGFRNQSFKEFRIIVCVDGSTDGTIEFLNSAKFNFEILILNHPENQNKGRDETRNLALNYLQAEFVLFIDSDILPSESLLEKHLNLLKSKDCISVGDVHINDIKENLWSYYLQTRGKRKFKNLDKIPAYYLNTQNVAFKSRYFKEIGGQDTDLSNSYGGDDTVLGHRIEKKFNIPAIFNQSAAAYSKHEKSLDIALKQMKEFGSYNLKIIKEKYPELNKIFKLNLMDSDAVYFKFLRLFLTVSISKILLILLKFSPTPLNLWIIQFLVFSYIYQGYKSK